MYCIYCITRLSDKKKYIGKAKNIKQRICQHKKSKRFLGHEFIYEILYYSEDHDKIKDSEEIYIKIFDTYKNGLNLTPDGTGNNYTEKFTTLGFKFSDETKRKLSLNHHDVKAEKNPMYNKTHSDETKAKWSKLRKGKVSSKKFDYETIEILLYLYKTKPVIDIANKIQPNGRIIDYDSAFCKVYAGKYNMTAANLKKIIKGKTIVWKPLYEKILNTKY
jgi:group I intron endonuclease